MDQPTISFTSAGAVNRPDPQVLPHTLAAPGLARRHLRSLAADWPPHLLDAALLLTSELVTNAVVHGLEPVHLQVEDDGDRLRVHVSDGAPCGLPPTPYAPTELHASGRGLLIVDAVAHQWGCHRRRTPPGKTVWFELRHDSTPT